MPIIFETQDFVVEAYDKPHHSRENGGHIAIAPKESVEHRYQLDSKTAQNLMLLSMLVGEAATNVLRGLGLKIVRINYQDNGNWAYKKPNPEPSLHWHLYFRSRNERHPDNDPRFQAFPEALVFPPYEPGFYGKFEPLTAEDCRLIKEACQELLKTKYNFIDLNIV